MIYFVLRIVYRMQNLLLHNIRYLTWNIWWRVPIYGFWAKLGQNFTFRWKIESRVNSCFLGLLSFRYGAFQYLVFVLDFNDVRPEKGSLGVSTSLNDSFVTLEM